MKLSLPLATQGARKRLPVLGAAGLLMVVVFFGKGEIMDAGVRAGLLPQSWRVARGTEGGGAMNQRGGASVDGGLSGEAGTGPGTAEARRRAGAVAGRAGGGPGGGPGAAGGSSAARSRKPGDHRPKGKSGAEMKEWAGQLVALKGTPELRTELDQFILHITPENWREAANAALPLYDFLHHNDWAKVMMRLGAVGGQEAAERFKPANTLVDYESYGARNVVRGWAAVDRAAAQAFVESLPGGRYRDGMGIGFLRGIDEGSAASLDKLYDQLPKTLWPQIAAAQRDIVRWEPGGAQPAVEGWLARTEAEFGRSSERFRIAQETRDLHFLEDAVWSSDGPTVQALAGEFFARAAGEVTDRVLATALLNLGRWQPAQALEWAQSQSPGQPTVRDSVPTLISDWAQRDLAAPGEWLNSHRDSPFYQSATAAYAVEMGKEDPQAAIAWAGTIQSSLLREAVLKKIGP